MTSIDFTLRNLIDDLRERMSELSKALHMDKTWRVYSLDPRYGSKVPVFNEDFILYNMKVLDFLDEIILSIRFIDDRLTALERERSE